MRDYKEWTISYDHYYMAPYGWSNSTFIGYEDENSIECKVINDHLVNCKLI